MCWQFSSRLTALARTTLPFVCVTVYPTWYTLHTSVLRRAIGNRSVSDFSRTPWSFGSRPLDPPRSDDPRTPLRDVYPDSERNREKSCVLGSGGFG